MCSSKVEERSFLKMFHDENTLFCAHKVVDYGNNDRRGMLVILEGLKGEWWNRLASELKHALPSTYLAPGKALRLDNLVN